MSLEERGEKVSNKDINMMYWSLVTLKAWNKKRKFFIICSIELIE